MNSGSGNRPLSVYRRLSVCASVRSITQKKTNDPKVFKLGIGISRVVWFLGQKVKETRSQSAKNIKAIEWPA